AGGQQAVEQGRGRVDGAGRRGGQDLDLQVVRHAAEKAAGEDVPEFQEGGVIGFFPGRGRRAGAGTGRVPELARDGRGRVRLHQEQAVARQRPVEVLVEGDGHVVARQPRRVDLGQFRFRYTDERRLDRASQQFGQGRFGGRQPLDDGLFQV